MYTTSMPLITLTCAICGLKYKMSSWYKDRQYCSNKCRGVGLKNKGVSPPPRTGAIPWNKGKKWPELSLARRGSSNPAWKGDDIGYSQIHTWVRKRIIKPNKCESCSRQSVLHLSNISYEYLRDLSDWEYLCVPCHIKKDRESGYWGEATRRFGL